MKSARLFLFFRVCRNLYQLKLNLSQQCFAKKKKKMKQKSALTHFILYYLLKYRLIIKPNQILIKLCPGGEQLQPGLWQCVLILSVSWQYLSCLLKTSVCQRSGTIASGSPGTRPYPHQWVTRSSTSPSMVHTHTHTHISIHSWVSTSPHKNTFLYATLNTTAVNC